MKQKNLHTFMVMVQSDFNKRISGMHNNEFLINKNIVKGILSDSMNVCFDYFIFGNTCPDCYSHGYTPNWTPEKIAEGTCICKTCNGSGLLENKED